MSVNDRKPNFRNAEGKFFLIRCYVCDPKYGLENALGKVASGQCACCGWNDEKISESQLLLSCEDLERLGRDTLKLAKELGYPLKNKSD